MATKKKAKKALKVATYQGQVVMSKPDKTLKKFGVTGKVVLSSKYLK